MDAIKNLAVVELDTTELSMFVGGDGSTSGTVSIATSGTVCCSGGATITLSTSANITPKKP